MPKAWLTSPTSGTLGAAVAEAVEAGFWTASLLGALVVAWSAMGACEMVAEAPAVGLGGARRAERGPKDRTAVPRSVVLRVRVKNMVLESGGSGGVVCWEVIRVCVWW